MVSQSAIVAAWITWFSSTSIAIRGFLTPNRLVMTGVFLNIQSRLLPSKAILIALQVVKSFVQFWTEFWTCLREYWTFGQ